MSRVAAAFIWDSPLGLGFEADLLTDRIRKVGENPLVPVKNLFMPRNLCNQFTQQCLDLLEVSLDPGKSTFSFSDIQDFRFQINIPDGAEDSSNIMVSGLSPKVCRGNEHDA